MAFVLMFSLNAASGEICRTGDGSVQAMVLRCESIHELASEARSAIESGDVVVVTEPTLSGEDIAGILSIPFEKTIKYQSCILLAYAIFKLGEDYVISGHYAVFAVEDHGQLISHEGGPIEECTAPGSLDEARAESNFDQVILVKDYPGNEDETFDYERIVDAATLGAQNAREQINRLSVSSDGWERVNDRSFTLPSSSPTATWQDYLYIYDLTHQVVGYANCSLYAYYFGERLVNGQTMKIYDVLSHVSATPYFNYDAVNKYDVYQHCNVTNFVHLLSANLPSGTTYTSNISLTGTYGSQYSSNGVTFTTTWQYNPEGQIIIRSNPASRVVKWRAQTVNAILGASYDIASGIRVASPQNCSRGAFSKVCCDDVFHGLIIEHGEIDVGGWF